MICAGIAVLIKPGEVFDLEMLEMELITIFVFQAIAGIVIAIRLRYEGEKGRFVLPIAILVIFAGCYIIGSFVMANLGLIEMYMIGEMGDFEIENIELSIKKLSEWYIENKSMIIKEKLLYQ